MVGNQTEEADLSSTFRSILTKKSAAHLKAIFEEIDRNGTGMISAA